MNPCDTEGIFDHLDVKQGVYTVSSDFLTVSSIHLGGSLVHLTGSSDRLIDDPGILSELQEIAIPVSLIGKASRDMIEETIIHLCEGRFLTIDELAVLLDRNKGSPFLEYIISEVSFDQCEKNMGFLAILLYETARRMV